MSPASAHLVFAFRPGLNLVLSGDGPALRHFRAEYGPASTTTTERGSVEVEFVAGDLAGAVVVRGGHKSVSWEVALGPPAAEPLRALVRLRGRPRSFGLSLVQGYFVEPLLALAAVRRGYVLLPAAAVQEGDAAVLLVGRSRSGKSSVCARALAAGRAVLGDDHVLLADGVCYPFPRRMRFYSDLRRTAPGAWASLPARARAGLAGRAVLRALTRGYVTPPVRVPQADVGNAPAPTSLPLGRIVLVERDPTARAVESEPCADAGPAVASALAALTEQRAKLRAAGDEAWLEALDAASTHEESLLMESLGGVPVERITLPDVWHPSEAINALAERLAIDPRGPASATYEKGR